MEHERVTGFISGTKSINNETTYVLRVKQEGHPLHGQKLIVWTVGNEVWALRKGHNVTFIIQNDNSAMGPVACDVLYDEGLTLSWFERFVLNLQPNSMGDVEDKNIMFAMLALIGIAYWYLYTNLPLTRYGSSYDAFWVVGLAAAWIFAFVYLYIAILELWASVVERFQGIIDYGCRSQYTSLRWEFGYHAIVTVGFAVFLYLMYGTLNGFPARIVWLSPDANLFIEVLRHTITAVLFIPLAMAVFLTATAHLAVRGQARPLFKYELNK